MKKLAIIGSGDFAKQVAEFAIETGEYEIIGFIDSKTNEEIFNGVGIVCSDDDVISSYNQGLFDCIFIGVGYLHFQLREQLFNKYVGKVPFANIIMPSAHVSKNVNIGQGVFLGNGTNVDESSVIGDNVFIHGGTSIGHDNVINSHTYLSGRIDTCGFCTIGKRCFIGIRVLVADHISICDDSWIGIGCIVAKNIVNPGKYMTSAAKLYQIE